MCSRLHVRCREGAKMTQDPRRVIPRGEWKNAVATNYSGKLGEEQVLGRMGSSGLDTSGLEFREQA